MILGTPGTFRWQGRSSFWMQVTGEWTAGKCTRDNGKGNCLSVSLKVGDYLQEQGALVIMTVRRMRIWHRGNTRDPPAKTGGLTESRLKMINDSEADLFLSIHLNSFSIGVIEKVPKPFIQAGLRKMNRWLNSFS